jgi:Leucine-rich repeat (LRR) protein
MKRLLLLITICISSVSFGQYTSIPDPNFEQALIDLDHDDVIDGQILTSNVSGLDSLEIQDPIGFGPISDLTGLQDFTSLKYLNVSGNQLSTYDFSSNLNLKFLDIGYCQISNVDISQNVLLETLIVRLNGLISIDVSNNQNLKVLITENNENLDQIDVSQNPLLEKLNCYSNSLSNLILLNNQQLKELNFRDNSISNIDLSQNSNLEILNVSDNPISLIDFISLPNLNVVLADFTLLQEVVINSEILDNLFLNDNPYLNCVNIKGCTNLYSFETNNTPSLICIEVSDPAQANALVNSFDWEIDNNNSFSSDCTNSCSSSLSITELNSNQPKELIKIVNLLGQEVEYQPNTVLIYIYSDGTSEKVFKIED